MVGLTGGDLDGEANAGANDAFLTKYDTDGTVVWTMLLGTTANDLGYAVNIDPAGDIFVTGNTAGALGGANAGDYDMFLSKVNSSGALQWTKQFGTDGYDELFGVDFDAAGNPYITGSTDGSLAGPNAGQSDVYLAKLDASDASFLWEQQLGTSLIDNSYSVAVDIYGNAYIAGKTYGDIPEPATMGLLALSGLALLRRRNR